MTTALALLAAALLAAGGADPARSRLAALASTGRLGPGAVRRRAERPGVALIARVPGRVVALGAVVLAGGVTTLLRGAVVGFAAAAVAGLLARLVADVVVRRRDRAGRAAVRTAVRVVVAELAAGSRPPAALAAAAQSGPDVHDVFTRAADDAARGHDSTALAGDPRPGVRALGVAWQLGAHTGAALAGLLERVADDLADDEAQRRTVAVALAGPRSSAVLVALLPVLGLALGTAMGAAPVHVLGGSPAGRALLLAGVLLDVAGVLWVRALLRRAERP